MLQELINLAEEIYAVDPDTGVRLGKMIEEVGKTLHYYHSKCQELHDNKVWMQLKIKKLEEAATMLRQQQAEIEALKERVSIAYWHDTFVEVKKPNSDLIYRFRLDDVCKHGVDDGACKECYAEAQEK